MSTPLNMVSSMAPPNYAEMHAARSTGNHPHEEELLRQISLGMQRKQKEKRRQRKKKNSKSRTAPRIQTNIMSNQSPVKIVRTDPNASSRKVVQAQLQDYMPTDTLTPSPTRRGRLLALSKEEEGDISDSIQDLREVLRLRAELAQVNVEDDMEIMPMEQEWADACGLSVAGLRRIITDGTEGRTRLVAANAGLVTSIAKRHYSTLRRNTQGGGGIGTILTLHDLVQEGNLGLMEAAERFDPSKGFRFSTYASYWIRQRISRSIEDSSRVIRLPAHGKLKPVSSWYPDACCELGISMLQLMKTEVNPPHLLLLFSYPSNHAISPFNAGNHQKDREGDGKGVWIFTVDGRCCWPVGNVRRKDQALL